MPTNFASIAADSHQAGNPAGARRVAIMLAKTFTANWPVPADIVAGEITTLPSTVLPALEEWALYEVPQNTISFDDEDQNDAGFQSTKQMVEFQLAGYSKELQVELAKHRNAGSVVLVELNDDQWACVGTAYNPIFLKSSGKSGQKGSDKRGKTLKGEQEGYMFGVTPLAAAVVADLTFAAIV
jgi:hypothetical protein